VTGTARATFQGEHLGLVWQSVRIPVHPSLHGLVEGISGYAESSARPVRRRETPNACVPVILRYLRELDAEQVAFVQDAVSTWV
jgi:hypothetical protein